MDLKESKNNTGTRHPWEQSRFSITQKLLNSKRGNYHSFIDIGSGDVYFSSEFCKANDKRKGYAVDIAFSTESIDSINKGYQGKITASNSLDDIESAIKKPVSVIFLMDVLEHIDNDSEFLNNLVARNFIDQNTVFFITVPAFQGLFCSHDTFLDHFRRYNNKQLKSVLEESGLNVNSIGYFYFSLLFPRLIKVFIEKITNSHEKDYSQLNHWKKGGFLTWGVKQFLMFDFFATNLLRKVGIKLPGLSNYAICQISA